MAERVVVDQSVGKRANKVGQNTRGLTSRLSSALSSPLGVLIVVPALVILVGVTLTLVGQAALRDSSMAMAEARFQQETTFTSRRMAQALSHSNAVLNRLQEVTRNRSPADPPAALAFLLRDLIAGRAGMSQAYVGFPDGTFQGVYIDDDTHHVLFQDSHWIDGKAHIQHSRFENEALVSVRSEVVDYDPRQRGWYKLALEKRTRVWTPPYPFFTTGHTGVTRAEPVLSPAEAQRVHAVIGVDYDVSALSDFMGRVEGSGLYALVYARDGSLLAYPRAAKKIATLRPQDHALNYRDLNDSLLNAYFASAASRSVGSDEAETGDSPFQSFDWDGRDMVTSATEVKVQGLPWRVASMASEEMILGGLRAHQKRSLLIAGAAMGLAFVVAWLFARHIVRVRREVADAREEAAVAARKATELGSYRLVSCLGKGGMGEVWRAEHRLLARAAALKLINAELTDNAGAAEIKERFKREAQTIAALKSRNTVALFDYGVTQEGTFFYVMEMLDGIDLESLVDKYGPQPAGRVIQILVQACNSLGEAHQAGLVHRDVKPANLFLCRAADEVDVVKVLDFGLVLSPNEPAPALAEPGARPDSLALEARAAEEQALSTAPEVSVASARLTRAGDYLGTPAFIAPEQALGHAVDGRSDLYALACIAFWLLTGELPFAETTAISMMLAHINKAPRPVASVAPVSVPAELEALILRCMAKDPDARPANARALARELRAISLSTGEEWTETDAQAWWKQYIPRASEAMESSMPTVTNDDASGLLLRVDQVS